MNWALLQNSLLVSGLTTAASVTLGFLGALWLAGLETRVRQGIMIAAAVALALPSFLVTSCWLHYLGHAGVWRGWLPLSIYSLGGTVWILTLLTWPIPLFLILSDWQRLEPSQLESETALRGWPLIRWLLLPAARSALGQAAVLTFVLALNNFAVPAILQTKVFPAELWVSFNTTFSYAEALKLSWPLLVGPLLLLVWLSRRSLAWPETEGRVPAQLFRRHLGRAWFWCCGFSTCIVLLLAIGLPLAQLLGTEKTWQQLWPAFAAGQGALWHSLIFASVASTACVVLSLVGWRWPLGTLLWIPFLVPGVLLGIALIYVLNRPILSGVLQSAGIVIVGFTLRYLAVSWNGTAQAMRSVDPDLTAAARLNGASRWQLLRHVQWPQVAPQLAAIWYITYLLCLWDVETLVLIIPPGGQTLALNVFNLLHYGHNDQVNALCVLLLGLAVLPWLGWWLGKWIRLRSMGVAAASVLILIAATGCNPGPSNESSVASKLFGKVQIIGTRGTGFGQFNKPRSVTVDRQDNLYVVDMTGRVQKFSSNGVFLLSWQMPQTDKGKPKGLCLDADGNIIVVEPHYARLNHFSPEGKLVEQWGTPGTNAGQLTLPRSVVVNTNGDIFMTEYTVVDRVQGFSGRERKPMLLFGRPGNGPGEFNRAEGICLDGHNRLCVADSCNHRIQIFSADGQFLRAYGRAGTGLGELSYPYDIQVDAAGLQFVCEFGNSRVQVFDAQDKPLEILGEIGSEPGQFNNPWSLALDSAGNLYVADAMNHRVQKFIRTKKVAESKAGSTGARPAS
jgi:ABC-type Fe3+ transport system permease subunit/DNA-binding beta-propeller fold protein YncE